MWPDLNDFYISLLNPFVSKRGILVENDHISRIDLMSCIIEVWNHFYAMLIVLLKLSLNYRLLNDLSVMINDSVPANE